MKKIYRKIHKYIGLFSFLFMIIVSITAIGLNHPELLVTKKNISKNFDITNSSIIKINPFEDKNIFASDKKGLFESKDFGKTWNEVKLFIPSENINNIEFSPNKKDFIAITIENVGLFISEDKGEIWEEISLPFPILEGEYIKSLDISNNSILLKTDFAIYTYNLDIKKWNIFKFDNVNKNYSLKIKQIVYELHTGQFFGKYGRNLYDLISIFFIILSISGLFIYNFPKRKINNKINSDSSNNKFNQYNQLSYKHDK